MFRSILTFQLLFAVAAGPWLCCCSTARLAAWFGPAEAATQAHASCCGHPSAPTGDDHQDAPKAPGDKAPCPCKEAPAQATTDPGTGVTASELARTFAFDFLSAVALPGLVAPTDAFSTDPASLPVGPGLFPSTGDLLYGHHNLRC